MLSQTKREKSKIRFFRFLSFFRLLPLVECRSLLFWPVSPSQACCVPWLEMLLSQKWTLSWYAFLLFYILFWGFSFLNIWEFLHHSLFTCIFPHSRQPTHPTTKDAWALLLLISSIAIRRCRLQTVWRPWSTTLLSVRESLLLSYFLFFELRLLHQRFLFHRSPFTTLKL